MIIQLAVLISFIIGFFLGLAARINREKATGGQR